MSGGFVRLDAMAPADWDWTPHPDPRYRFDSATGRRRVRYASTTPLGAARERYRDTGRFVPTGHADHHRVDLDGTWRVLDLRRDEVLDALGLDARVSSSYEDAVRQTCWKLSDLVGDWWGEDVHAIAYSSRTTPETATNVAFFQHAPFGAKGVPLADCGVWLDELVVGHGFTVDFAYP